VLRGRACHRAGAQEGSALPEWQVAIQALLPVSRSDPTMLVRIGVMKALNRHVEEPACRAGLTPKRCRASRAKSVDGVGDNDADAKNYKKCCNSFKHGAALTQ